MAEEKVLGTVTTTGQLKCTQTIKIAGNYGYIDFEIDGLSDTNTINLNETLKPKKIQFLNKGWAGYTLHSEIPATDITWKSSNDGIFTVDKNGVISATGKGSAVLTATLGDCVKQYTINVEKKLESISLPESKSLYVGNSEKLELKYTPLDVNLKNKKISWSSSKPDVAQVDNEGKVTAISEGTTEIKVVVEEKEATCLVTVTYDPSLAIIKFDKKNAEMEINDSTELTIKEGVEDNSNITWKVKSLKDTSKEYDITDSAITKYIKVEKTNDVKKVKITVNDCENDNNKYQIIAYKDGKYYGVFTITVNVPLEEIKILGDTIGMSITMGFDNPEGIQKTEIDYNNQSLRNFKLKVLYMPSNATLEEKGNEKWTIENTNIIKQNDDGSFQILKGGTTRISVQVGSYHATLEVNIINDKEHLLKGDVDRDGEVTLYDALQILKQTVLELDLSDDDRYIMDFDDDGQVTLYDSLKFLQQAIL